MAVDHELPFQWVTAPTAPFKPPAQISFGPVPQTVKSWVKLAGPGYSDHMLPSQRSTTFAPTAQISLGALIRSPFRLFCVLLTTLVHALPSQRSMMPEAPMA